MTSSGLHISINAEKVFSIGDLTVTNAMFTSLIVSGLLIGLAFVTYKKIKDTSHPTGWQNFIEWLVESLLNLVTSTTKDQRKTWQFLPWIAAFFLFILLNNWLSLLPGVGTVSLNHHDFVPLLRPGTADLNTTLALAIFSLSLTQIFGLSYQGFSYLKKFLDFSSPIKFFVGFLEAISEMAKIISFAFRLFGNIFAGEVLLVVISFLLPVIGPVPFYGLEIFVGFIQALVFAMLSLVFFNMATQIHE